MCNIEPLHHLGEHGKVSVVVEVLQQVVHDVQLHLKRKKSYFR